MSKFDGKNFDINTQGGKYWCDDCKRFVTDNKTVWSDSLDL
jgi:hypothetical protein